MGEKMTTTHMKHGPFSIYNTLFDFDTLEFDRFFGSKNYHVESTAEDLTLAVDLPGVKLSDLNVQVEGHTIKIAGKQRGHDVKHSYQLSKQYDPTTASAKLEDGVLTVKFLKREEAKPKIINVQVK